MDGVATRSLHLEMQLLQLLHHLRSNMDSSNSKVLCHHPLLRSCHLFPLLPLHLSRTGDEIYA